MTFVSQSWLERRLAALAPERAGPLDTLFEKQREVVEAPERFKALLCGSRAGKTEVILRHIVHAMGSRPGAPFLYTAQARTTAKNILWEPLRALNIAEGWGLQLNESELRARHPNGAWLLLAGMDSQPELEKARGIPWQGVYIDECGSHRPSYLKYYVEEVIHPRLMDRKGWCWLAGTPTSAAAGYFYDITEGAKHGWRVFRWTARDNPHVDYHDFVYNPETGWLALRDCTEESPAFKREILGEWSVDSDRLIFRYLASRNAIDELPTLREGDRWETIVAADFGVGHHTAVGALYYPAKWGRDAYLVDSWQETGLAPSDAALKIRAFCDTHNPVTIVGDVNGLGKGFEREWNKHFPGVAMRPAKKDHKRAALEIVSDRLHIARSSEQWDQRRGLFVVKGKGANDALCSQLATLQWDEERKDVEPGQIDDLAMMMLYGYRYCRAFENKDADPPEAPVPQGPFDRFVQRKLIPKAKENAVSALRGAWKRGMQ